MQAPRTLPTALAIGLIAFGLAACGVAGDPVRPAPDPSSSPTPRASDNNPNRSSPKVFYETSRVVGASREHEVIPQMPPRQWQKGQKSEPERGPRALTPLGHERRPSPDQSFLLDWLL